MEYLNIDVYCVQIKMSNSSCDIDFVSCHHNYIVFWYEKIAFWNNNYVCWYNLSCIEGAEVYLC